MAKLPKVITYKVTLEWSFPWPTWEWPTHKTKRPPFDWERDA
jgi:hypothetical protein